jgi:hypothetical protein
MIAPTTLELASSRFGHKLTDIMFLDGKSHRLMHFLRMMVLVFSFILVIQHSLLLVQAQQSDIFCLEDFCSDGRNCAHPSCQGCPFTCYKSGDNQCINGNDPDERPCSKNCSPEKCHRNICRNCSFCSGDKEVTSECPLGTFQDVTDSMFSKDGDADAYWYQWKHSGKPYNHFTSPVMVDLDGDLMLDYFSSLHGASMDEETNGMMELAIMRVQPDQSSTSESSYFLDPLQNRIILEDIPEDGYQFWITQ